MFGFARIIARNAVLLIALVGAGYFLFGGKKDEPAPSSPWAVNAPAQVASSTSSSQGSMTDKVLKAADSAAKYAGVSEYTPSALKDQAVGNLNKTEGALAKAGAGQD